MSLQQVYTRLSLPFSRLKQSGGQLCPGALIGPHAREREREREKATERDRDLKGHLEIVLVKVHFTRCAPLPAPASGTVRPGA